MMDKNIEAKRKPSGSPLQQVSDFLMSLTPQADQANSLPATPKMALAESAAPSPDLMDLRAELRGCFEKMESTLLEKMTALIKPIATQMQ